MDIVSNKGFNENSLIAFSYEQQVIWEYERLGITPNDTRPRDLKILKEYKNQGSH